MHCRVCDSDQLQPAIDLGTQPWCNHFLKQDEVGSEPSYPLRVVHCAKCQTAQLDYTVKKEIMFGNHTYLSGVTKSLSDHFKTVATEIDQRFFHERTQKAVLDIGSNDGTQLKHFQSLGYDVLGVESSQQTSKIATDAGVPTLNTFFNHAVAVDLNRKFEVINAAGVFFHLEELHSVTQGIREALAHDGVFVVQFLYMKRIVENTAFDQIYHEHLLYYNLKTIQTLLERHGLSLFDAHLTAIHGGSIIAFATHQKSCPSASQRLEQLREQEESSDCNSLEYYMKFAKHIEEMKERNLDYLGQAKAQKKRIYGLGAPVKGNTMLNYFGVGTQYLDVLVEKNALRKGLFSPGMHIPVVMEDELLIYPDIYFVLAWNFKEEILRNNKVLIEKGVQFYFPVDPKPVN
ncbi:MAG: class I SAM-dependent methyltransferase [Chlamydiales bacterium]|nr:class I SAM-dependent methyltransferase [Chlamydiales bacterium]